MRRPQPTNDEVRAAMDHVLAAATAAGRRPTVSAVERHLGIAHATFYRSYGQLIQDHFQPRARRAAGPQTRDTAASAGNAAAQTEQRQRAELSDLRKILALYEEAIRQLATDNDDLRQQLAHATNLSHLRPVQPDRPTARG